MCIPSQFPSEADAAGPRTPLGKPLPCRVVWCRARVGSGNCPLPGFPNGTVPDQLRNPCPSQTSLCMKSVPLLTSFLPLSRGLKFVHVSCHGSASRLKKKKSHRDIFFATNNTVITQSSMHHTEHSETCRMSPGRQKKLETFWN